LISRQILAVCASGLLLVSGAAASDKAAHPHWGYDGDGGPDHWGSLQTEYEKCASGQEQSPIDLSGVAKAYLRPIDFSYASAPMNIVDNGHTIQVDLAGSSADIRGRAYDLLQFHFHAPSEHKVDGASYPMELHLVHRDTSGSLAVVGLLIKEGKKNPVIAKIWKHLPSVGERAEPEGVRLSPAKLLPADKSYFQYAGSLTTPPCSEGVNWNVLRTPIQLSAEQINAFRARYAHNARPVQPLHGRSLRQTR